MVRQEAVDWLNYRLDLDAKMMRNNHFTLTDIEFFTNFIRERTGKSVYVNEITNSIRHHSESCMSWVERLINYLVYTHKIEVITENAPNFINKFMGVEEDSLKILKYK